MVRQHIKTIWHRSNTQMWKRGKQMKEFVEVV